MKSTVWTAAPPAQSSCTMASGPDRVPGVSHTAATERLENVTLSPKYSGHATTQTRDEAAATKLKRRVANAGSRRALNTSEQCHTQRCRPQRAVGMSRPRRACPVHNGYVLSTEGVSRPQRACPVHSGHVPSTASMSHPQRGCPVHRGHGPSTASTSRPQRACPVHRGGVPSIEDMARPQRA